MNLLLLLTFVLSVHAQDEDAALCSARTCSDYLDKTPCALLSDKCKAQNSTQNGLILPSPDPCNCCTYCIDNLKEGEFCAAGETGGMVPDSICGPGLICSRDEICVKMEKAATPPTDCTKKQADYDTRRDSGELGVLEVRPTCDSDGFYEPYKCIPGLTCFCVDKEGKRLFGEISYTSIAAFTMKCQCSRKYATAVDFFDRELYPNEHFRCVENGDYDTIQCLGNNCMCTDVSDGAPTFPKNAFVNMSDISADTLKDCFNKERHEKGKYYYECASKYLEVLEEITEYKKGGYDTVFEVEFPKCTLDGKYAAVQQDSRSGTAYCADSDGNLIKPYSVPIAEMGKMNCYCARTTLLLRASPENPECCPNGNFNPVQCRRGVCYCVDDNGYQQGKEVTQDLKDSLNCDRSC